MRQTLGFVSLALLAATASPATAQDPLQAGDKARMFAACQQDDAEAPSTLAGASLRAQCWEKMKIAGMGDATVEQNYIRAIANQDSIIRADSLQKSQETSTKAENDRRLKINEMIARGDLDGAKVAVDDWTRADPTNRDALRADQQIRHLRNARTLKYTLVAIGGVLIAAIVGLSVLAKKLGDRHRERVSQRKQAADQRKAMLKVIDGIGRGRFYTMENNVFRIGAANSDKADEHNDLVLSDSAAAISRYHCSVMRRDGRFYLIDSSLNGTELNDELLDRGEDRMLADGDEFTLANVSRVKFLLL
jgi:hypothetical protein